MTAPRHGGSRRGLLLPAWVVLLLSRHVGGDIALSRNWRAEHCVGNAALTHMVVAVASDAPGLAPILAAVNSTYSNARDRDAVSFVAITRHVRRLHQLTATHLPHVMRQMTICGGFSDLLMQRPALLKLTTLRNSTRIKRKELLSPFNFAAFYLPYVLRESRSVLYLDTDTVVKGDVGELEGLAMHGAPAAAVEDCSQKIFKYINFDMLSHYDSSGRRALGGGGDGAGRDARGAAKKKKPTSAAASSSSSTQDDGASSQAASWTRWGLLVDDVTNETCVFNRGVVLFDCRRWRELRLTETIEDLVDAFVESRARLWRGGISQPPFLLTLAGRYHKLDLEWNVRGLGRMDLGRKEWLAMAGYAKTRYATDTRVFERHMAPSGPFRQTFNPFLCPYAAHAKILHFNGDFKPWMISGADLDSWRSLGLNVSTPTPLRDTATGATHHGPREITGTCRIEACPTAVNVSTGRRLRSACEAWHAPAGIRPPPREEQHERPVRVRWDQQRRSLDNRPWDPRPETVSEYYATGCIARPPLCTCLSDLSDECVTTCASHWHEYVSGDVFRDATGLVLAAASSSSRHQRPASSGALGLLPLRGHDRHNDTPGLLNTSSLDAPRRLWYEDYHRRRKPAVS